MKKFRILGIIAIISSEDWMKIGKISKRDLKKDKAVQQRCMNPDTT